MELTTENILALGFFKQPVEEDDPHGCERFQRGQFYLLMSDNPFEPHEKQVSLAVRYGYFFATESNPTVASEGRAYLQSKNKLTYEDLKDILRIFN